MTQNIASTNNFLEYLRGFFRLFVLTYLFFYMFPYPLSDIPVVGDLFIYYERATDFLTLWFGHTVLKITSLEKLEITGSGDTTFDYVKLLVTAVASIFISASLFVCGFNKNRDNQLHVFITTYARYYVGLNLITYGLAKWHNGQFPFPDISRMEQTFGSSSPMGLLWTFMGYSKTYKIFTGLCEILGGVLLFFRRTTVLGGLVSLVVMTNVVFLNFAYDVPVKLFSTHLALISFFIFYPNLKTLLNFFILNKSSTLSVAPILLPNKRVRFWRIILKSVILMGFPALMIVEVFKNEGAPAKHNLNGAYFTQPYLLKNNTSTYQPPDTALWKKLIIEDSYSQIVFANDQSEFYQLTIDTATQTIHLSSYNDTTEKYALKYQQLSDGVFLMAGQYKSDSVSILLKRKELSDYPLVKRGFHWINEYPYNR